MNPTADSYPEPSDVDLKEIVDQVWESYLDPDGSAPLVLTGAVPDRFDATASISITGPWHGHVVIATSRAAATGAAAHLRNFCADQRVLGC